ncbi:MAG: hypothetical protein PVJ86_09765 [Phycisphaerales bacterium]|jgi:hypothetical protein
MARLKIHNLKLKTTIRRLLTALILAVLLWLFFILAGRALCYIAIQQIAELTNTEIRTESVDFHTNGSVFIRGLVISPSEEQNGDDTILKAGTVYARFSLSSLLLLRPRLKVIDVNDFVFNARYDLDMGRWNLSALKIKPPKGGSDRAPRVRLKTGILQYSKISSGQTQVAVSVPINAEFGFDEETQDGYSFEITTATMASGFGRSRLTGFWKPGSVTIAGGISSVDVPEFEMAWIIDTLAAEFKYDESDTFSLKLRIKDLQSMRSPALDRLKLVGPAFLEKSSPFAALQRFFDRYQPRGRIDIDLETSGNLNYLSESTLTGKAYCRDIAICHYKFQYAIEHLAGQIDFTKNSATLNNLSGKHGDVRLSFNGWSRDFGPDWKYQIQIASDNIPLDNDLYNALSTKQQEFWSAFSPAGFAAIDYRLSRKSQTDKQRKLTAELRGAEAIYEHFPYPLKNLTGKLSFDRDKVVFSDVVSQVNERKITLNGEVITANTDKPIYDISAKTNNIPLDSTLEAALPEKQRNLYKRFRPSGLASGWVKIWTQDSGPASFTADLSFEKASLKSDQFPLPVSDISARAVFSPDLITVREFSGLHGDASISLTGQIQPDQEYRQSRYRLSLKVEDTELNDDLLNLLPESTKKIVAQFKPEGRVNLIADLNKESLTKPPDCGITVKCLGNNLTIPKLPYPLKDTTGTLTMDANNIKLKDITATLGDDVPATTNRATIKLDGEVSLVDAAFSGAMLHLSANNILFDEQLRLALSQRGRTLYDKLSPAGLFDLDFENIRIDRADDDQESLDFTGAVTFKDCSFKISGSEIELVDTALKTEGSYKTGEGLSSCQAALDGGTLKTLDKSFTNLKANISYDPNSRSWSTEDLIADWYSGRLRGKFVFKQPAQQAGEYVLQTGFDNVDLRQFLSDTKLQDARENGYTTGKMNGSVSVNARIDDNSSRIGTCRLAISDMQVSKLSPLAKLLNVLQLTEPRDFAYDQMFVDSYIRHDGLFVRKLDLSGQGLAFSGSGSVDLKSLNVDLTLTARGRRLLTDDPSVLQSLTEGLGQAVVRMDITGNLYDPKITRKTLPVIEDTLHILGAKPATPD